MAVDTRKEIENGLVLAGSSWWGGGGWYEQFA